MQLKIRVTIIKLQSQWGVCSKAMSRAASDAHATSEKLIWSARRNSSLPNPNPQDPAKHTYYTYTFIQKPTSTPKAIPPTGEVLHGIRTLEGHQHGSWAQFPRDLLGSAAAGLSKPCTCMNTHDLTRVCKQVYVNVHGEQTHIFPFVAMGSIERRTHYAELNSVKQGDISRSGEQQTILGDRQNQGLTPDSRLGMHCQIPGQCN